MNRSASTLITKRDGLLTTKYGELRALQSHDSQALQALIRQSIATSKGRGFGAGGIVSIARATRPQLQVLVTPVRSTSVALIPQVPAAAVFIVDPTHRAHPRVETLRKTFSLTTAEARLALLLSKGRSLTQIAEALGVSRNTLHTQLGSVFRKTGTSRQGELISLLMQFPDTKAAETTDDGSSEASHESNGTT